MKCIPHLIKKLSKLTGQKTLFFLVSVLTLVVITGCSSSSKNLRANGSSGSSDIMASKRSNNAVNKNDVSQSRSVSEYSRRVSAEDAKKYKMALASMEERDYSRAHDLFKEVADKNPNLSGPLINLGIIALKQDNNLQAESFFQQAIKFKSDNAEVYNYLGIAYRQQGRFSDANTAYKTALKLDDSMAKTYLNLGILNDLYLSNYLEAQKYYIKYQQLNPENKQVNAWLVDLKSRIQASVE